MELTPEDVDDILALLDSLPYNDLDLRTSRFHLTLHRTPGGWTQSTRIPASPPASASSPALPRPEPQNPDMPGGATTAVRAPLPGTFYRAPHPGAPPFVEVGSRVDEDSVIGIVETMKLMNPVHAGTAGRVAGICLGNGEFAASGAVLILIEAGT